MAVKNRIGIIGGGAVGLTYACFLADVADVIVKTRTQSQANSLNSDGILLTRGGKTQNIKPIHASAEMSDLKDCQAVIVTVKSYDTENMATELSAMVKPDAQVISLQNGIESVDVLKSKMSNPERVFAGVTYIGAQRTDERSIGVGQFHRTVVDAKAGVLIQALQASPYGIETLSNAKQAVWDKMIQTNVQNALSAVTNLSARQMLQSEPCLEIAVEMMSEFQSVAEKEGITFEGSLMDKLKDNWGSGDDFYPSMWQDLHKGNRTEIDAINGAISKLGKKHGVDTHYHTMITSLVKALEKQSA